VVGERTFQQLTEDFADLIIPKIWEHENRKVARVAKRLSISPKKVRRVLARLGCTAHELCSTAPWTRLGLGYEAARARNRGAGLLLDFRVWAGWAVAR
jgi:hypothetical protein